MSLRTVALPTAAFTAAMLTLTMAAAPAEATNLRRAALVQDCHADAIASAHAPAALAATRVTITAIE